MTSTPSSRSVVPESRDLGRGGRCRRGSTAGRRARRRGTRASSRQRDVRVDRREAVDVVERARGRVPRRRPDPASASAKRATVSAQSEMQVREQVVDARDARERERASGRARGTRGCSSARNGELRARPAIGARWSAEHEALGRATKFQSDEHWVASSAAASTLKPRPPRKKASASELTAMPLRARRGRSGRNARPGRRCGARQTSAR